VEMASSSVQLRHTKNKPPGPQRRIKADDTGTLSGLETSTHSNAYN